MSDHLERSVAIDVDLARRLRLKNGLKTQDIAKQCFTNRKTVSRWFSGTQEVSVSNLPRLAKALRCTVEQLTGVEPYPEEQNGENVEQLHDPEGEFESQKSGSIAVLTSTKPNAGIKVELDSLTEEEVSAVLAAIQILIKRQQPIPLLGTRGGCMELLIHLTPEEIKILEAEIQRGALDHLKVIGVNRLEGHGPADTETTPTNPKTPAQIVEEKLIKLLRRPVEPAKPESDRNRNHGA